MAPTRKSLSSVAAVQEEVPDKADLAAVQRWLHVRRDVIANDVFMHPVLKQIMLDQTSLAPERNAESLGISPHRLWGLRVSDRPHPHPSRFIAGPRASAESGASDEFGMHSGRKKWVASKLGLVKVRPRYGMPRARARRPPRRTAVQAVVRTISPQRLEQLAAERERRFQARHRAIKARKLHPVLEQLLLERHIWTIGTACAEFGIGIGRLGFTRSDSRSRKYQKGHVWFDLEPDTVEGIVLGRENVGIEAGRARQWALDNDWLVWDAELEQLVLATPPPQTLPLTELMQQWQQAIRADVFMHPVLKDLLLDMRPCDLSRASDELDITVYRLERLRASNDFLDPSWFYPGTWLVPLGLLRLWAMHTGRLRWIGRAALLVPVVPRHGRPALASDDRRRNPSLISRMEDLKASA